MHEIVYIGHFQEACFSYNLVNLSSTPLHATFNLTTADIGTWSGMPLEAREHLMCMDILTFPASPVRALYFALYSFQYLVRCHLLWTTV